MSVSDDQSVQDGLWTTLIGTASKQVMETYITNSAVCMNDIIPKIVKRRVQEYEKSDQNQLRSMRVLYEGGMVSKQKYTNIRNSSDVMNNLQINQVKIRNHNLCKAVKFQRSFHTKL